MAKVYLGLGSNMGNRHQNLIAAIRELKKNKIEIKKKSSIIETDPVGGPPQGKFLNAVVEVSTSLTPQALLKNIKMIEKKLGRKKSVPNGPRTIDIDILLYDQAKIEKPNLTIPHPRMLKRSFVLTPLKEIAPKIIQDLKKC